VLEYRGKEEKRKEEKEILKKTYNAPNDLAVQPKKKERTGRHVVRWSETCLGLWGGKKKGKGKHGTQSRSMFLGEERSQGRYSPIYISNSVSLTSNERGKKGKGR